MKIRCYHWLIYWLFRRTWNPIFRDKPVMAQRFIDYTQHMIDRQDGK